MNSIYPVLFPYFPLRFQNIPSKFSKIENIYAIFENHINRSPQREKTPDRWFPNNQGF